MLAVLLLTALQISFVSPAIAAPQVEVSLTPQSGTADDEFQLEIKVTDGEVSGEPRFASSRNFTLTGQGLNRELSYINGHSSSSTTFSFRVDPHPGITPGEYQTPAGQLTVDSQTVEIPPQKLKISRGSPASEQAGSASPFVQTIDNDHPYIGEQLTYRAEIAAVGNLSQALLSEIDFDGFWRESYGEQRQTVRRIGGQQANGAEVRVYTIREALFPTRSGQLEIPARRIDTAMQVPVKKRLGLGGFGQLWPDLSFFDRFSQEQRRFSAPAVAVQARPLPPPPPNKQKYIPVGKVTLDAKLSSTSVNTGDSLTLTLTLRGDANLRPLELTKPAVAENTFRFYEEPARVRTEVEDERIISEKTFSIALVPLRAGEISLPEYQVLCFDPKTSQYYVLKNPAQTLQVGGTDIATPALTPTPAEVAPTAADTSAPQGGTAAEEADYSKYALPGITLLAGFFGLGFWIKRRRKSRPSAEVLAAQNALSAARAALAKVFGAEDLLNALRDYISARFFVNAHSFTAQDVKIFLKPLVEPALLEEAEELFTTGERMLFGNQAAGEVQELQERALALLEKLDAASHRSLPVRRSSFVSVLFVLALGMLAWVIDQQTRVLQAVVNQADVVALSAPMPSAQAVAKAPIGVPLKVLDVQDDWVQVILPGDEARRAWISGREVTLKEARIWDK